MLDKTLRNSMIQDVLYCKQQLLQLRSILQDVSIFKELDIQCMTYMCYIYEIYVSTYGCFVTGNVIFMINVKDIMVFFIFIFYIEPTCAGIAHSLNNQRFRYHPIK